MASLVEVEAALEKLSEGGPVSLGIIPVINNIVEIQVKSMEAAIEEAADDIDQAKIDIAAMKVQMKEYLNTADAKAAIKAEIDSIKASAKAAHLSIMEMPKSIANMIAENVVPPMITVPPAPANPATMALKVLKARSDFKTLIESIGKILADLFKSALKIKFELPDAIVEMVNTLAAIKNTVP